MKQEIQVRLALIVHKIFYWAGFKFFSKATDIYENGSIQGVCFYNKDSKLQDEIYQIRDRLNEVENASRP